MLIKWLRSKLGKISETPRERTKEEIYSDAMDFKAGYYAYHSDVPYNPDMPDLWKEGYLYAYNEHKC